MTRVIATSILLLSLGACKNSKPQQNQDPRINQLFSQMDSNNDGLLSKSEVKGPIQNDFAKIDSDNDGFISKEELAKAPKPQGNRGGRPQGPPRG